MDNILSEGLEQIARIDEDGFLFDSMGNHIGRIDKDGYIQDSYNVYGRIDMDGIIRDSLMNPVGRIQADGYIYIHSTRVGRLSSSFIEKITPRAFSAGEPSSYSGRKQPTPSKNYDSGDSRSPVMSGCLFGILVKLIIGIVLGIILWASGYWGPEALIAAPLLVFFMYYFIKIIHWIF